MAVKVYEYANCDTCRKALKFLDARKVPYEKIPIVERPPSLAELKSMLGFIKTRGGSFKNLFNTSGQLYREMGLAERLQAGMTEAEALSLLAKNGKLIKRPFVLSAQNGTVGFQEETWKTLFPK